MLIHLFGYYTKMQEASCGKDTMTDDLEMMGLYIDKPFQVFPMVFLMILLKSKNSPVEKSLVTALQAVEGKKRAKKSSNNTRYLIKNWRFNRLYFSFPVLQIAAHEEITTA